MLLTAYWEDDSKIVTIVWARLQFIKAAAVLRVIRNDYRDRIVEVLVHTGQHFDENMPKVFFDELDIPHPDHHFGISGGSHGEMTGGLAAVKLHIPDIDLHRDLCTTTSDVALPFAFRG